MRKLSFVLHRTEQRLLPRGADDGMPVLGDPELQKLSDKRVNQILTVSEQPLMLDAGKTALEKAGFQIEELARVTLALLPFRPMRG